MKRIAIDLGTTNSLVYLQGKGVVINEPSVVALSTADNKVVAIGNQAKEMLGRTPESIIASHPLRDGVIANYKITEAMLRYFIDKVSGRIRLFKPDIMVAVPAGITSTERRAVIDACLQAGGRRAYIIKEPLAAALGAGIPIAATSGHMVIDIGGGTTEVAVIALGDIVTTTSVRVAGNKIDQAITDYIRKKFSLIVGEQTAEQIKIQVGSASKLDKELKLEISGSNSISGLPESMVIKTNDIVPAIKEPLDEIIAAIKSVLQKTPPELAADVIDKGIIMTGGSAQLRELDKLLTKVTGVLCQVAEEPKLCVVKGTGMAAENLDEFKRSVLWAR